MLLDFTTMDRRTAYFWMASTIAPRPVAWVSTQDAEGHTNLAPYSFFQMVTPNPPTLMISTQMHGDGSLKDTARNIRDTGEFVISLVSFPMVDAMNATSFAFDARSSEFERVGVTSAASHAVKPPRVDGAPMSFECRLTSFVPHPSESPTCVVILGEVVAGHVDPAIVGTDGIIDPAKLDLVSRMGAEWYGRTKSADNFTLARPAGWAR
ncbi:MAG TPA: flavin reductase family protein [Gemmatimonadaceae bacterium]|nr:flavin reductase family protein [Gemmatimonadaceae bacterium]